MYYHRILPVWTSLPSVESDCGSFKCLRDHWVTAAASQSDSEVEMMNLNPANPGSTPTDTCVQESLVEVTALHSVTRVQLPLIPVCSSHWLR